MFIVIVPSAPVWALAFLKVATAIWQEPNCLGNQTWVLLVWATLHTPHCIVKPVELSREAQGHPRSIFAIARRVWVHTDIGVRIYICSNSAISVRIAGDSNHRSKRCKCSWKGYVNRTAGKINSGSPLDRKACGIITCLTKAENSKPWRPVVRPNRYGWIWIVDNTVFIVFGWTTRVWNNCPLNRSNGRKTSWETNAASGVCINHHPRNCKSRGVITC